MVRKKFTDNAGYTRHCWECANSRFKKIDGTYYGHCLARSMDVEKYDSPNNPCSFAGGCWQYFARGGANHV